MLAQDFIGEVKTKNGDQRSRDGRLVRDIPDRELLQKMLDRYPGERSNIEDLDDYLDEDELTPAPPETDVQKQLDTAKKSLFSRISDRSSEFMEKIVENKESDANPFRKKLRELGNTAGFVGDVAMEGIKTIPGAETAIEKTGEVITEIPGVKPGMEKYQEFAEKHPEASKDLGAIFDIASLIPIGKGAKVGLEATETGLKTVGNKIDDVSTKRAEARALRDEADVEESVGRIVQGKPEDIERARKALSKVDTEGVKTYEDLNTRMDEKLRVLRNKVDTELEGDTNVYNKFKLARKNEIEIDGKKKEVFDNPTISAIDELEDYYTKIKDVPKLEKVKAYRKKLEGKGLRLKEVNDIARMHGADLNAFGVNNELASGLSKQAAENTRKGLKATVRQNLPDDKTRALDESMSEILNTKDLTKKMEDKVNTLKQKMRKKTFGQQFGEKLFEAIDFLSIGTMRGFLSKLNLKTLSKTEDVLELEKELEKNLKKIEKKIDEGATEEEIMEEIKVITPTE